MATVYATLQGRLTIGRRPRDKHVEIAHGFAAGIMSQVMQRIARLSDDGREWLVPGTFDGQTAGEVYAAMYDFRRQFAREIDAVLTMRRRA